LNNELHVDDLLKILDMINLMYGCFKNSLEV